jgi:isopenicillin N synthase-like dioxygenase
MSHGFKEVPILDWNLEKSKFILQLRDALINVGFLYLQNPPVQPVRTMVTSERSILTSTQELIKKIQEIAPKIFDLSDDKKRSLDMSNSPHFLSVEL